MYTQSLGLLWFTLHILSKGLCTKGLVISLVHRGMLEHLGSEIQLKTTIS